MRYFIKTFGCAANEADSERVAAYYEARGYTRAKTMKSADDVVINTCMIRASAEHRVYGLVHNLTEEKKKGRKVKIVVTGCMVGMAAREKTGKLLSKLKEKMPGVDEFLPIEEVGFDFAPIRTSAHHAWVPISNGCNNFCTFCVVPFTRGREVSRSMEDILGEINGLVKNGIAHVTLVGQNVNSYGADLEKKTGKVTYVKHLGRLRIPTIFPQLLEHICAIEGVRLVDFISSNPWDFSDDLIDVIRKNEKISKRIHLPVQAGDNEVLKKMNRWYTREEYMRLAGKLKEIPGVTISTDIIVGFPGETREQFEQTVDLAKRMGFTKAYVAMYSDRPMTAAHKTMNDSVPFAEKKRRWKILEELINQTNLKAGTYQ
ncbi:MAG TPA: MiaB/RimO family radical SAM methylthiotransferase [Patescibacteria group bacterium]|nr:MiaB/RimO family radical SAM methylthiotransferase [Patescibacteria group bacterium]